MKHRTLRAGLIVAFTMAVAVVGVWAGEWPCWRGPDYDGISDEKGFKTRWEQAPPKLWEAEIGSAFSACTCVDGKLYTCGTRDKHQVVFCFNADTGAIIWQAPIEEEFVERQGGDGTRSTPTINEGKLYVQTPRGLLVCLDASNGKEVWKRNYTEKPAWGYAASVLIEGDLAVAMGNNALVALDKKTGGEVWSCPSTVVGYATPYPFTMNGKRFIVGFMGKEAIIVEAGTGRKVWSMPWETSWDVNAATPIFHEGYLLLSSGYKHGAILLHLRPDGGDLKSDTVWQNKNIRAKFQTPVLYRGYLYTSDEEGLKCVDFKTGAEKWSRRGITFGTVVIADGKLLIWTEKGELMIAPVSPEQLETLTNVRVYEGRNWTVPTLYKGRLYVRNLERLGCFDLKP